MLPNPGMNFTPFDPLPASDLNDMVENIESLSDGTGFEPGAIGTDSLGQSVVEAQNIDFTTFQGTWTPTMTSTTGTLGYARYTRIGNWVFFELKWNVTSVSGSVTATLPFNADSSYNLGNIIPIGRANLRDTGTNSFDGIVLYASSTTMTIWSVDSTGTFAVTSSSVPFTWASGDFILAQGMYLAA